MKYSFWGMPLTSILTLLGATAYAAEAAPTGGVGDGHIFPINGKSVGALRDETRQWEKTAAAPKAKEQEKNRAGERQTKVNKLEQKTGRTAQYWQILS
jgi:hypothetical protein